MSDLLSSPNSKKGQLQRAVLDLLNEHRERGELPTNGRFVFYELEQRGVVSKMRTGARRADQDTADALYYLRERELVPWSWIIDETRTLWEWEYAATVTDYLAARVEEARINPWPSDPPLLLVESRSLGGVLRNLAGGYLCPLAATNGQVGGFLRTDVVPALDGNDRVVLYLGDLDHQGGQIEANTRRVLEHATGRRIDWRRVAITMEQVDERGIEPIIKKDNRYRPALEHDAWETEALGQGTVLALVQEELARLLPAPLAEVRERERAEQSAAAARLHAWDGTA